MLKLQLLHVMAFFILIGKTISSSVKTPSVTAQIGQDPSAEPSHSKDIHSNEMVLMRARSRPGKGEFRMLLGSTCPVFLRGRCPPCPAPDQGLVPVYVLKKGGGEAKKEVVCSLVRLQENSGRSNSLVKLKEKNTGVKDLVDEESQKRGLKRVKREQRRGGKVEKLKDGKKEGGEAIELLDFSETNAHENTNHEIGEEDIEECINSNSPDCNMAALMTLLEGDISVRKSDMEIKKNSHSHHSDFQQRMVEGEIDLGETIKDISEEEDRAVTVELSPQEEREPPNNPVKHLKTPYWSPCVAIVAVFLISMAAFVIVARLLIRRLDMATNSNKVRRSTSSSNHKSKKPKRTLPRKQASHCIQVSSKSDLS